MPQGLAGGALQAVLMTPVGVLLGSANLFGQMCAELITGAQPSESTQLMLGAHVWGQPGVYGGAKLAAELQHAVMDGDEVVGTSAITLAATRPYVKADGSPASTSGSLSIAYRPSSVYSLATSIERTPDGSHVLTAGGTRALDGGKRVKGRVTTAGILALALDVAADASSLTLCAELGITPSAAPARFGATVSLNP